MSAGLDRVHAQSAAAILVRAEGRPLHCVVIRPLADAHGGRVVGTPAQGHALHGNVRPCQLNLLCYITIKF